MRVPITLVLLAALCAPAGVSAQQVSDTKRVATRDAVERLLKSARDRLDFTMARSEKAPFNLVGTLRENLDHSDALEIVLGVSNADTISISAYPHYRGDYINVERARNAQGLMRQILHMNHTNFMFWAIDEAGDIYARYTFTLESGIPDESIIVVLRSIKNIDQFVGDMLTNVDGTPAPTR